MDFLGHGIMKDVYWSEKGLVPKVYLTLLVPSKLVLQGNLVLRNDGKLPREKEQIDTFCRGGKKIPGLCEWLVITFFWWNTTLSGTRVA